jgi:hypothetical protein
VTKKVQGFPNNRDEQMDKVVEGGHEQENKHKQTFCGPWSRKEGFSVKKKFDFA